MQNRHDSSFVFKQDLRFRLQYMTTMCYDRCRGHTYSNITERVSKPGSLE